MDLKTGICLENRILQAGAAGVKIAVPVIATLAATSCGSEWDSLSVDEAIAKVSTPWEAQQFIKHNIKYDHWEEEQAMPLFPDYVPRPKPAINGGNQQSLRLTLEGRNGFGVCRDASIAAAAVLKDNGFDSLILSIDYTQGPGHSVFVYQGSNGKWGSIGINDSDYRDPEFDSVEAIARNDCSKKGKTFYSYHLSDMSSRDLVNGDLEGMVWKGPFEIESLHEGPFETIITTGEIQLVGDNTILTKNSIRSSYTETRTIEYDSNLFMLSDSSVEHHNGGMVVNKDYVVLQQAPCGLPAETDYIYLINGELDESLHQAFTYNSGNNVSTLISDRWNRFWGRTFEIFTYQYDGDEAVAYTKEISRDGDEIIDTVEYYVKNSSGIWVRQ